MEFDQLPKGRRVIEVRDVGEFVDQNVVDEFHRQRHHFDIQIDAFGG